MEFIPIDVSKHKEYVISFAFYKKNGMKQIKTEMNGKALRMSGTI